MDGPGAAAAVVRGGPGHRFGDGRGRSDRMEATAAIRMRFHRAGRTSV
jgi:hypothetical protein